MNPSTYRKTASVHRKTVAVRIKTVAVHRKTVAVRIKTVADHRKTVAAHRKTVIPSEASRRLFFRVRSCERVGLRREESLFDLSPGTSAPFLSPLRALCANIFPNVFPTTHHSLLTSLLR